MENKYKDGSPTFLKWLIAQKDRDDQIGDLAKDTDSAIYLNYFSIDSNFTEIYDFIYIAQMKNHYLSGEKTVIDWLLFAWDEYENKIKIQKDRKKYIAKNNQGYVYFIGLDEIKNRIKIGFSSNTNFIKRQKNIETASPYNTFLVGYIESKNYVNLENELHKKLNHKRAKREWFNLTKKQAEKIILNYNGILNYA